MRAYNMSHPVLKLMIKLGKKNLVRTGDEKVVSHCSLVVRVPSEALGHLLANPSPPG